MKKNLLFILFFLTQSLTSQIIVWNKNQPLTWENFKATEKQTGWGSRHVVAAAHCGISFSMVNSSDKNEPFQVTIQALFDESKSWKRADDLDAVVLKHEQGHFDIAEIYARKMRRMVKRKIKTIRDYNLYFRKNFDRIYRNYNEFQEEYDRETSNQVIPELQEIYDRKIEKLLKNSEEYAEP